MVYETQVSFPLTPEQIRLRAFSLSALCRLAALLLLADVVVGGRVLAAPALLETYDGPEAAWRQPERPGATRIASQQRIRIEVDGEDVGAEHLVFQCPAGYSGVFLYPIGQAPVLEEFSAAVRYRGSRPGAQLAVRVVFPRARRSTAGGLLRAIVRSEVRYDQANKWQELSFSDLPRLVQRQARLMRAQGLGASFDDRGAYVDAIGLIVPSGPRGHEAGPGGEFWTERLEVHGVLAKLSNDAEYAGTRTNSAIPSSKEERERSREPFDPARGFVNRDRAFFPRAVASNGEQLSTLQRRGFNVVALGKADAAKVSAAARLGLQLVIPFPQTTGQQESEEIAGSAAVLGWSLPTELRQAALDAARPAISKLHGDPGLSSLPLFVSPYRDVQAWSRLADVMLLSASRSRFAGEDFFAKSTRVRPGTPVVAVVPLTRSPQALDQLTALAPVGKASPWRPAEDIQSDVWQALAGGARGLWFEASQPLGGSGPRQAYIASIVERINLQVSLIEPWLVSGTTGTPIRAGGERPVAALLQRGRTRLLIGCVDVDDAMAASSIVLPAISETAAAYQLTPAGLSTLRLKRVNGGVELAASVIRPGAMILLTDDRHALHSVSRRLAKLAPRAVALEQELAAAELLEWQSSVSGVAAQSQARNDAPLAVAVRRWMSHSKAAQARGDHQAAYLAGASARELMRRAREEFRGRIDPKPQLVSSPLTQLPQTWTDEFRLRELLRALPRGQNLLPGGDFEDLASTRQAGWRHASLGENNSPISLSTNKPANGKRCLALQAVPSSQTGTLGANAWVLSPVVPLRAGQLVEITGWVRLGQASDLPCRLLVMDSLGGEELALSIEPGEGWRQFKMIRRATARAQLRVAFAKVGKGQASLDAVMVRPVMIDAAEVARGAETASMPATHHRK